MVEPQFDSSKFQAAVQNLTDAVGECTSELLNLFVDVWNNLQPTLNDLNNSLKELSFILNEWDESYQLRIQAKATNLVSGRVIHLSCRKGKTGKKNLNRIRKQIKKHGPHNS